MKKIKDEFKHFQQAEEKKKEFFDNIKGGNEPKK